MNTKRVPALAFSRFAVGDLVRWRALVGGFVSPRNARWGSGRVSEVRWEGRSDKPEDEGTIYVRVEYSGGLRVRVNAKAFARLHDGVEIEPELADFVGRWFADGEPVPESEFSAALAAWDLALRVRQDEARSRRALDLRRRAQERRKRSPRRDIEA